MNLYIEDNWMIFDPASVAGALEPGYVRVSQRKPDGIFAEFIVNALRAADEAQAWGDQALSIARIKLIYHLLEDVAA